MRARLSMVAIGAGLALLAGCTGTPDPEPTPTTNGVENLAAEEILDAAKEALLNAASFRVVGEGEQEGQSITVDMVFADDAQQGEVTTGGMTWEMLVVDDNMYFRGDASMWSEFLGDEAESIMPLLIGTWVKMPLGQGFDLDAVDILEPEGEVEKGEVTTLDGQPVIVLTSDEGELYVSLVGEPYPVKLVNESGELEFTDIGEEVTIEAPENVFDLESVAG